MNKVPGKIKISYVLVEIFERPLNIPNRPSIENIGIEQGSVDEVASDHMEPEFEHSSGLGFRSSKKTITNK